MKNQPWSMARVASRRALPKPIKMHGPVGMDVNAHLKQMRDSGVDLNTLKWDHQVEGAPYCKYCRYSVCSCVWASPQELKALAAPKPYPMPVQRPGLQVIAVGDRVWHVSTGPLMVGVVVSFNDSGLRWLEVKWNGGTEREQIDDSSPRNLRRAGDTEWLRALPPETLVRSKYWGPEHAQRADIVLTPCNEGTTCWELVQP